MRFLYSALLYCCLPFILMRLLWRSIKAPAYARRWLERFGFGLSLKDKNIQAGAEILWVHAVSVGETIAAVPMVRALLEQYPHKVVLMTSTTPTGSDQVSTIFADEKAQGRLLHCYAPYDLPDCIGRFLNRARPQLLIIMETEIWPNTIAACGKRRIPVVLANGRLSEKSARGYQKIALLVRPAFRQLATAVVQHGDDAERMINLGLRREACVVSGNIKFDLHISEKTKREAAALRQAINPERERVVWIAASTHKGEEETIIEVFLELRKTVSNLLLILVPRHPERFNSVVELCRGSGLKVCRRSADQDVTSDTDVLVGDTMGELLMLYGVADLAFVGGSLVEVGGHNLMEPAAWGLPIVSGPHLRNFAEASHLLTAAGAMQAVNNGEEMVQVLTAWIEDPDQRIESGATAVAVAENNRGALSRLLDTLGPVVHKAIDHKSIIQNSYCSK